MPALRLIWLGLENQLTANPVEFITRSTGSWALIFLCLTLAVSPIHHYFPNFRLLQLRRTLGLFSFFYACLHFLTWLGLDLQGDWGQIINDLVKRTYLTIGLLTFVLLIPLAITSNKYFQNKLGRSWKKLHRLVYVIAILAIIHYWRHKVGKNNYETVLIYAGIISILLVWRLIYFLKKKNNKKPMLKSD